MPSRRATVTEAEIRRCLKAAREAGYEQARVEFTNPDGTKVSVVAGKAGEGAVDDADDIDRMIGRVPHALP